MGNNLLSLGTRSGKSQENQPWRKFGNKKLKDVDHDATDEVNLLMDRWSPSDVLILMRKLHFLAFYYSLFCILSLVNIQIKM